MIKSLLSIFVLAIAISNTSAFLFGNKSTSPPLGEYLRSLIHYWSNNYTIEYANELKSVVDFIENQAESKPDKIVKALDGFETNSIRAESLAHELKQLTTISSPEDCHFSNINNTLVILDHLYDISSKLDKPKFLNEKPKDNVKFHNFVSQSLNKRMKLCIPHIVSNYEKFMESDDGVNAELLDLSIGALVPHDDIQDMDADVGLKDVAIKLDSFPMEETQENVDLKSKEATVDWLHKRCDPFMYSSSSSIGVYLLSKGLVPNEINEKIYNDKAFRKYLEYERLCNKDIV